MEKTFPAPVERYKFSLWWYGVAGASAVFLTWVLGIILVHVLGGPLSCLITLAGLAAITLVIGVVLCVLALRSRNNALPLSIDPPDSIKSSPLLKTPFRTDMDEHLIGEGYSRMYKVPSVLDQKSRPMNGVSHQNHS